MKLKHIIYDPQQENMDQMFVKPGLDIVDDDIWHIVQARFRLLGFELFTPQTYTGDLENVHFVIFQNMPLDFKPVKIGRRIKRQIKQWVSKPTFYQKCIKAGLGGKLAVILYEPEVIASYNYDRRLHGLFQVVFTWSVELLNEGQPYNEFVFPQPPHLNSLTPQASQFNDRKLICNFSANKKSIHTKELYSARIKAIRFLEDQCPNDFDHYGRGWSAEYKSWRGPVVDKLKTMSNYRFNLCYENAEGLEGYVTEKIFDAFHSGCVPIYWGAPDIDQVVPTQCFIDRRAFASNEEMLNFIKNMDEQTWRRYISSAQEFLKSARYAKFEPNSVFNMLKAGLGV